MTIIVSDAVFENEEKKRLCFGLLSAVVLHGLILWSATMAPSYHEMEAAIYSPPTQLSIRFTRPAEPAVVQKTPEPLIEPKKKKRPKPPEPVQQVVPQEVLPAPAPIEEIVQKQPEILHVETKPQIPIVSEAALKGRRVSPHYPKRALRLRQEGVVWLHVLISETGARQEIKLYKPSQYALLNQAAIKAVKQWTFDPNIVNGHPMKTWVEIPIEFKIR